MKLSLTLLVALALISPAAAAAPVERAAYPWLGKYDPASGRKAFLLAQGFMPAQDMHILRNHGSSGPWYDLNFGPTLRTPEWTFAAEDLRRF